MRRRCRQFLTAEKVDVLSKKKKEGTNTVAVTPSSIQKELEERLRCGFTSPYVGGLFLVPYPTMSLFPSGDIECR